jgi:outer membrane protein assembly factor BamB
MRNDTMMPLSRSRLLLCLGLFLCARAADAGDHWERFRGPNGDGVANDKGVPLEFSDKHNVLWKTPIPGDGNSSPIVWGERVFLQTASTDGTQRMLLCLAARDGKVLWTRSIPGVKVKIRYDSSLASSTPTTDGAAVYIAFWDGKDIIVSAYDMQGTPLWNRNLGEFVSQHGAGASPILYKDKLLFVNDMDRENPATKKAVNRPALLLALNKKTGAIVWEIPREAERACYSAPFLHETKSGGAPELIVVSTTALTAYNPDDGTKTWELPHWQGKLVRMPLRTVASATLVGNTLIASSGDGAGDRFAAGVALEGIGTGTKAQRVWENSKDFPYVPCPLQRGPHLYFVNDAGFAGCYEARSGQRIWHERVPGAKFTASPVMIDGKIYAASDAGDVFVFAADPNYRQLAKNTLGERIRATPAVANDRLYIRGQNHLFCIGKQ